MFERICAALQLGRLTEEPARLSGGYTHRMYRLRTDKACYAVKLLDRQIMQRSDALTNYRRAEGFERLLEQKGLPILPALEIGGSKLQRVEGQYLYVFDFYPGRVLQDEEIQPSHCMKMGEVLARIHGAVAPVYPAEDALTEAFDWAQLTAGLAGAGDACREAQTMQEALLMLEHVTKAAREAVLRLPRRRVLCHNDMDAKNVLWQGEDFRIIDLECLSYADPLQEMLDLAVSWAGWPAQERRFKAFAGAYYAAGGERPEEPALLYDSRWNHIEWLAYNARRALQNDPEERRIGREQVLETIGKIQSDQRNRPMILQWMNEV